MWDLTKISQRASIEERFKTVVQNSGPLFQKLLQRMARERGLSPGFVEILQELENNVKPLDDELMIAYIKEKAPLIDQEYHFQKRLASGTVAQVYLIEEKSTSKPYVLRVLRPHIRQTVDDEYQLLQNMAPLIEQDPQLSGTFFASFRSLLKDYYHNAYQEFLLTQTKANQEEARQHYVEHPELGRWGSWQGFILSVPKVVGVYGNEVM